MKIRNLMVIPLAFAAGCALVPERLAPVGTRPSTEVPAEAIPAETMSPGDDATPGVETEAPEMSAGTLGRTVASLGNAAEPGLWLKTPLVKSERPGTVFYPMTGRSVQVTLIPIDGPATAGSRLSLQAMQALGAPLTGLPEIDVMV